ncbi:MAG: DUF192 domain-containing protein [Persicimonas sp.]
MNQRSRAKRRRLSGTRWVVGLAFLCAACACDRGGASGKGDADRRQPAEQTDTGEERSVEGVGQSCKTPEDCDSYLTCVESTCRIPAAVSGEADASTPSVRFVDPDGETVAEYHVELAVSAAEKRKGLMFRREMAEGWGMLFVYDQQRPLGFWMKNTFLPLDMVFIDGDGRIVRILEDVEPLTEKRRRSKRPARYVLELEAGTAAEDGLERGMTIELNNVEESLEPDG